MVLDAVTAIIIFYGFWVGYSRGIITIVFTYASILIGATFAFKLAPYTTKFLTTLSGVDSPFMFIAGVVASFLVMMWVIRLIGGGIVELLDAIDVELVNQVLGGVLSAGFFALIFSIVLWFGDQARMINESLKAESLTYRYTIRMPHYAKRFASTVLPFMGDIYHESMNFFDRIQSRAIEHSDEKPDIYDVEENEPKPSDTKRRESPTPKDDEEAYPQPSQGSGRRGI